MKKRDINLEILRIVCMIVIVSNHALNCVSFLQNSVKPEWIHMYRAAGGFMVDAFILINGYFMCDKKFEIRKLVLLWTQIWFITTGVYLFLQFTGKGTMHVSEVLNCIFPISRKVYWFITIYFLLYICSPYINIVIKKITEKQYKILMGILTVVITVVPCIWNKDSFGTAGGYGITLFVYLYLLAGYIKKYDKHISLLISIVVFICSTLILYGSIIYYMYTVPDNINMQFRYYRNDGIFVVIQSVAIFSFFKELHMKNVKPWIHKFVTEVAGVTFGIYLIHCHPWLLSYIWGVMFPITSNSSFRRVVFGTIIVFVVAGIIDLIRKQFFEIVRRTVKGIDRKDKIVNCFDKINKAVNESADYD